MDTAAAQAGRARGGKGEKGGEWARAARRARRGGSARRSTLAAAVVRRDDLEHFFEHLFQRGVGHRRQHEVQRHLAHGAAHVRLARVDLMGRSAGE